MKRTPYELGELRTPEVLDELIEYIELGTDNEKRLAASAVSKIALEYLEQCYKAIEPLISLLDNKKSQVRQYALKTLLMFELDHTKLNRLEAGYTCEEKEYNQSIFEKIFKKNQYEFNKKGIEKSNSSDYVGDKTSDYSETQGEEKEQEVNS